MAQKCVTTVKFEIPVAGEGAEGYKHTLDTANGVVEAIRQSGATIMSHHTAIKQVKAPNKPRAAV
jgi:hypothetical protein